MPEYIIWDWNGTLLDDSEASLEAMNNVLDKYGMKRLSRRRYMDIFTFPVVEYYKLVGFDLSKLSFEELSAAYVEEYAGLSEACALTRGAREVLDSFKNRGLKQILLSASEKGTLLRQAKALGVDTYFYHIIGADNIHAYGKAKLAADFIKASGLKGEDGVLIGDTLHDYETALSINCRCILYFSGHQSRDRLVKCGSTVIDRLTELINLI